MLEHRSIDLSKYVVSDLRDEVRTDTEDTCIERGVVDFAHSDCV